MTLNNSLGHLDHTLFVRNKWPVIPVLWREASGPSKVKLIEGRPVWLLLGARWSLWIQGINSGLILGLEVLQ